MTGKGTFCGFVASTVLAMVLAGCGDTRAPSDAGSDGGASDVAGDSRAPSDAGSDGGASDVAGDSDSSGSVDTSSDGTVQGLCCAIDETPTCNCRQTGGTRQANGICPAVCDAVPIVEMRFLDENGCPTIKLSNRSCLDPVDASMGD
jgi:hypothetical protein